jgi:hypothetical protein
MVGLVRAAVAVPRQAAQADAAQEPEAAGQEQHFSHTSEGGEGWCWQRHCSQVLLHSTLRPNGKQLAARSPGWLEAWALLVRRMLLQQNVTMRVPG